jgi:peptidyl-prolyl cis-trans isomerase SurA
MASELEREMASVTERALRAGQALPPQPQLRQQALEQLILLKLQLAAAARAGIQVDAETMNRALHNIAQRNNLTLEEMAAALTAEGISFDSYREQLKTDLILSRLHSREVLNRIQITTDEIDDYLAQHQPAGGRQALYLRHMLIALPEGASPAQDAQAHAKAQALQGRLAEGADFAALARAESDGQQAANGGDLGWMRSSQVPSLFADALQGLEKGDVAGPLKSASGYHLVQLVDYQSGQRAVINQTHVRHILIKPDELVSEDEARIRLEQLRERISGGADFATLARSHSDDKGSASKGGDLGWVSPGDLVPAFEETMAQLAANALSQPVRSQFGWHLIQVLGRRQHDATDEVLRSKARQALRQRKAAEATQLYLQQLRNEAFVDIRLDNGA